MAGAEFNVIFNVAAAAKAVTVRLRDPNFDAEYFSSYLLHQSRNLSPLLHIIQGIANPRSRLSSSQNGCCLYVHEVV